eukprot:8809522-Lingulodinium_polyedra.AAC.1
MPPKVKKSEVKGEEPLQKMPKQEVSKMLGVLKYHASDKSKAGKEYKTQAQVALETYQGLSNQRKAAFLGAFKMSKGKDLSWTTSFQE